MKFIKNLFVFLVSSVLLSQVAMAGVFSDVEDTHVNYKAIQFLKEKGFINGYSDNTFKPGNNITRAEATKVIVSAIGTELKKDSLVIFSDVTATDWFFQYVMTAYDQKIVSGDKSGKFRPNDTISLSESLKIIAEAFNVELPKETQKTIYADVPNNSWFAKYAQYAKDKNIVLMDEYGNMGSSEALTRARFAEIMYRFIYVKEHNGEAFPIDSDWMSYESELLPFIVRHPSNFEKLKYSNDKLSQVTFWQPDKRFFQFSPERTYPNTAKFVVTMDPNTDKLTRDIYFSNIKQVFSNTDISDFKFEEYNGLKVAYKDSPVVDYYIYLDKGKFENNVLVVYTSAGSGIISEQNRKVLDAMFKSFAYRDSNLIGDKDKVDVKSKINSNILIEGQGNAMFELMTDEVIVETDTIGVGTGPVDYYYSAEYDITLKYERSGDVILDVKDGKTTSF